MINWPISILVIIITIIIAIITYIKEKNRLAVVLAVLGIIVSLFSGMIFTPSTSAPTSVPAPTSASASVPTPTPKSIAESDSSNIHVIKLTDLEYLVSTSGPYSGDGYNFKYYANQSDNTNVNRTDVLMTGRLYSRDSDYASISYNTGGKFALFGGILFLDYEHRSTNGEARIRIYGDDKVLFDTRIENSVHPIEFLINITNVSILKIEVRGVDNANGNDRVRVGLTNAILSKESTAQTQQVNQIPLYAKLTDLEYLVSISEPYSGDGYNFKYYTWQNDNTNEMRTDVLMTGRLYSRDSDFASISYLLDKEYSSFECTVFLGYEDKNTNGEARIRIYGDDKVLYDTKITGGVLPLDLKINVADINILRIEARGIDNGYGNDRVRVGLSESILHKAR